MADYVNPSLFWEAITVLIVALLVSLALSIRRRSDGRVSRLALSGSDFAAYAGICGPLATIAFATGFLTGFSRQPAVTAAIPAILTLLGGIFAYIAAAHPAARAPMAAGVVLFSIVLVVSTNFYSSVREGERMKRLLMLSEQERLVRIRRENMDLPPEFPSWILSGETAH
jgi:hypothetical protein